MKPLLPTKPLMLLLVCMAVAIAAKAQLNFAPQVSYPTGSYPYGVAVGDFNNDGKQDLAIANEYDGNISILLGNGDGTFQPQVTYAAGNNPQSVAIGDFNGDGKQDLVVSNFYHNAISVLLGNGDGTFETAVSYGTAPASFVAVGDFNGDGRQDLVAAITHVDFELPGQSDVYIFLGAGDGTFQPPVSYAIGLGDDDLASIAINDYNNDGVQDLAVADYTNSSIVILSGAGDGTFPTQAAFTYEPDYAPYYLASADFNGDGKPDIAAINWGEDNISVLLGNGNGSFQPQVAYATGANPQFVTTGDFNGDGKKDLAIANVDDNNVSVLLGNGDGTFQSQVTFATSGTPGVIVPADFNGDGKADLAVTNSYGIEYNTISILLNTTPFATPVTLISFTGALQNGLATLSWQSGVESNFKQYEVEAGTDNKNYATVGFVAAKGSNQSYTFSTAQAAATANYRLKLVDNDGKYTYSNVITLSQSGNEKVTVYPNPTHNTLNINSSVTGIMHVYTAAGQLVKTIPLQAGKNVADITTLSMGVYYGIVNGVKVQFVKK